MAGLALRVRRNGGEAGRRTPALRAQLCAARQDDSRSGARNQRFARRSIAVASGSRASSATTELTGTGDAKLWGFFPDASNPRIEQIDKTSGAAVTTYNEASLAGMPTA